MCINMFVWFSALALDITKYTISLASCCAQTQTPYTQPQTHQVVDQPIHALSHKLVLGWIEFALEIQVIRLDIGIVLLPGVWYPPSINHPYWSISPSHIVHIVHILHEQCGSRMAGMLSNCSNAQSNGSPSILGPFHTLSLQKAWGQLHALRFEWFSWREFLTTPFSHEINTRKSLPLAIQVWIQHNQ